MGTTSSKGIRDSVRSRTGDTHQFLDLAMDYMLKNANLVDFYSLADPTRCRQYVVAGRDALLTLFQALQVRPEKDKGVLYFQRIDGLKKAMPPDLAAKQQEYCLELSFFFIRIFQIFGALVISAFDVELPTTDILEEVPQARRNQAFVSMPFAGGARGGARGGALTGRFELKGAPYTLLNKYLTQPRTGYGEEADKIRFTNYSNMYIPFDSLYEGDLTTPTPREMPVPQVNYYYQIGSAQKAIYATLVLNLAGDRLILRLERFMRQSGERISIADYERQLQRPTPYEDFLSDGKNLAQVIYEQMKRVQDSIEPFSTYGFLKELNYIGDIYDKTKPAPIRGTSIAILPGQEAAPRIRIVYEQKIERSENGRKRTVVGRIIAPLEIRPSTDLVGTTSSYTVTVFLRDAEVSPADLKASLSLKEFKTQTFLRERGVGEPLSEKQSETIPVYLMRIFKDILERREEDGVSTRNIRFTKEGYATPFNSEAIPPGMRVKKIWEGLRRDPPVKAFCVARALQLISPSALEGAIPASTYSSVCRTTFRYQKDGSVPTPSRPITEAYGIYALATLFLDTIENGTPRITDTSKYEDFLRAMKFLFEKEAAFDAAAAAPKQISDVREKLVGFCDGESRIRIDDSGTISYLRKVALSMIERQVSHVANVMKVIQMLFDVKAGQPLKLHTRVKKEGIPYIDSVAVEARKLLLAYYTDCEKMYREGLKHMYESRATLKFEPVRAVASTT